MARLLPDINLSHNSGDCHSPLSHSHTLSVRRHNQELSWTPAPRGGKAIVVVVGACAWVAWDPGAGDRSLLRQLLEAAAASAAARRRREGGREGYVTAKQNTDTAARWQNHCCCLDRKLPLTQVCQKFDWRGSNFSLEWETGWSSCCLVRGCVSTILFSRTDANHKTSQELRMLSPSLFIQGSQCKC